MKRIFAMAMILCLLSVFGACGKKNPEESTAPTTTADADSPAATTIPSTGDSTALPSTSSADDTTSTTAIDSTTLTSGGTTEAGGNETAAPTTGNATIKNGDSSPEKPTNTVKPTEAPSNKPTTKEQILQYYANAINTAFAKKPGLTKNTQTVITKDIHGDEGVNKLLNLSIPFVKTTGRQVVNNFLGIGDPANNVTPKNTDLQGNGILFESKLTPAHVTSAICEEQGNNYKLTINLMDETNPKRDNSSAIGSCFRNYKAKEDVYTELKDYAFLNVKIDNIIMKTHDVMITAIIDKESNQFSELKIEMPFDVRLEGIKVLAFGGDWGEGSAKTTALYTAFQW